MAEMATPLAINEQSSYPIILLHPIIFLPVSKMRYNPGVKTLIAKRLIHSALFIGLAIATVVCINSVLAALILGYLGSLFLPLVSDRLASYYFSE